VTYLVTVCCVLGIAAGQLLFKASARAIERAGTPFDPSAVMLLGIALALYGITTLAWVWVLQRVDLGHVYPFMALAFALVPLGSYLLFGERFQPQYFLGVGIMVTGLIIAVRPA
jgi:drug/metabolite transporter (DMT)-like permease